MQIKNMQVRNGPREAGPGRRTMLCAAVLACLPALADEAAPALETIVVTAAGYEQKIKEAPASISVITRAQLEGQPFASLADAVRHIEGVSIVGADPNDTDVSIRGMPGDYTLVLVDGQRQGTRETMNRGSGGVQGYFIPPLEAIERIEVVRGPMSSLYGSDAIGGVINIITRKAAKAWHGSVTLGATLQRDSAHGDGREAGFWLGGPLAETLGLQLYGDFGKREEDRIYFPENYTSGANGSEDKNLTAKLTLTPVKGQTFTVEAGRSELIYARTPGKSIDPEDPAEDTEHLRRHLAASHAGRWDWGSSTLALSRETGSQITRAGGGEEGVSESSRPEIVNTVLDGQLALPLGAGMLKLGGQYSRNVLSGIADESPVAGHGASPDRVRASAWALFAEDEYALTEQLTLTGGLRLDDHRQYGAHWSPRVYAVYQLGETITLRGGLARGFKAPTLRQTTAGYCMTTGGGTQKRGALCGNPDLKPETSTTGELGIRFDGERGASLSATLFDNRFENKVVSYDTGVPDPRNRMLTTYRYDNLDRVDLRGLELGAGLPLAAQWKLSGNYTYTRSERRGGGEPAFDGSSLDGRPLDKTPEHLFNARLDWTPTEQLNAYLRASYLGKQYWAAFRNGAVNLRERGASTTVDLGGSYAFGRNLTLSAAVLNLADRTVAVDARGRYDGLAGNWMVDEGRRLWLGLNAGF